jgi:hypothetical protein
VRKFRVKCGDGTCTVLLTERGVRFPHHINAHLWAAARAGSVLDSLSGRAPEERWGCQRVAELVAARTYTAVRFPEGAQLLLATLYGLTVARKRKKQRTA